MRGSGPKYERYRAVRSCWVHTGSRRVAKAQKEIALFDKAVGLGFILDMHRVHDGKVLGNSPFV